MAEENNKTRNIIIGIVGVFALAGGGWAWYAVNKKKDEPVDPSVSADITNRAYQADAQQAVEVLKEMQQLPAADANSKVDMNAVGDVIKSLNAKYPELQNYITQFLGLDKNAKAGLLLIGLGIALNKNKKTQITARSVSESKPVWLVIVDETFKAAGN